MASTEEEIFEQHQSQVIGLAYRITGSRAEAEDIAQDTFLKWLDADRESIDSPRAWLLKVAARKSLDYLKSAKVRRTSYVGPWLPEPFVNTMSPDEELELDETLSLALLVLLEQLTSSERAVFILHDLFHFDFNEVGEILEKTPAACRKLASRGRAKIGPAATANRPSKPVHLKVLSAFLEAVKQGELAGLIALLTDDVTLRTDGGGKAPAARKQLQGSETVAKFFHKLVSPNFAEVVSGKMKVETIWFNGSPGLVVWDGPQPITAFSLDLAEERIRGIYVHRNPDKLRLFEGERVG